MKQIFPILNLHLFVFLLLKLLIMPAYAQKGTGNYQDESIFTFSDTSICMGDKFVLKAFGATGKYKWSGEAEIANPDSQFTSVNFSKSGTYRFIVTGNVKLNNIAYDGQFERFDPRTNLNIQSFPPSFASTYGNASVTDGIPFITNDNQFLVDTVIRGYSPNNASCPERSFRKKTDPVSGSVVSRGKVFYADGNTSGQEAAYSTTYASNHYLWQLSGRNVLPNTNYEFSVDVAEWNNGSPSAEIMLLVNGSALPLTVNSISVKGLYYTLQDKDICQWKTVTGNWNSGNNKTATITISEPSKQLIGHEIALDDISFSTGLGVKTDTVFVKVKDCIVTGLESNQHLTKAIYPNPSSGTIKTAINGTGRITIFNALGLNVFESEILSETALDISSIKSGIYFYTIKTADSNLKGQLIIR